MNLHYPNHSIGAVARPAETVRATNCSFIDIDMNLRSVAESLSKGTDFLCNCVCDTKIWNKISGLMTSETFNPDANTTDTLGELREFVSDTNQKLQASLSTLVSFQDLGVSLSVLTKK